jgi:hypothetical protein
MKRVVSHSLSLLALAASIAPAASHAQGAIARPAPVPWLFAGSDIPVSPAWRFGILPNGLRYAVRQNKYPAGTLAIRVRIDAGALMERDDEKGFEARRPCRTGKAFALGSGLAHSSAATRMPSPR